eukprot:CAMPEP_0172744198 /NCGR_PEP_ID=MMETSP1074-20121228/134526_1 /TAXON_ID=2916 /ORGANISM="Ceratium fusus, Strain PA161109" /LENGTH=57 /DNA_ID=CAMNT_0013575097 /DNA_START=98 /DNA_END=271 /DNA_ORIENTATION=+
MPSVSCEISSASHGMNSMRAPRSSAWPRPSQDIGFLHPASYNPSLTAMTLKFDSLNA